MLAWGAYVAGEIETAAGRRDRAEQHYVRAIDLARTSGATFLVGVATVGLLAVRAAAGRVDEALGGYREVIDYFARTGNWTHQWTTLRNLADLLRRLGDDEPAALLDAAADRAPDAPARGRPARRPAAPVRQPRCSRPGRRPARWPGRPSSGTSPGRDPHGRPLGDRRLPPVLDERLLADPRGVAVDAHGGDEPGRLGRLRRQRPDLARRDVRGQHQVDRQPVSSGVATG